MVEHRPNICETLGSKPRAGEKGKKKEREREEERETFLSKSIPRNLC